MARIRSIHPDACDSEKLSRLSDSAERTLWRLITHTDDEGRGEDRPKLLAAKLYPLTDERDAASVDADLAELEAVGMLIRYEVDGRRFYAIPTFREWQKPRHPAESKYPEPPSRGSVTAVRRSPTADVGKPPADAVDVRSSDVTAERRKPPAGEERSGEGVGEERNLAAADATASKPRRRDLLFEAVAEVCGIDYQRLTRNERGKLNNAAKQLRDIDATPDEVHGKAAAYRRKWPDAELTPMALVNQWSQVDAGARPLTVARCPDCEQPLGGGHTEASCELGTALLAGGDR